MIAVIAAYAKNRVIGNNGCIPWKIKGEQKRFRELTTGNVVIMGRRSFEEIGKLLPNRTTIVVSTTKTFAGKNCYTAKSLQEAIQLAGDSRIFISGGARLYEEALPIADKMYITEIDQSFEGDTFFPKFETKDFIKEIDERCEGEVSYSYVTYTKKTEVLERTAPCSLMCHTCSAYKNGMICESAKQLLKYMDGVKEFYEKHHPAQTEEHNIFMRNLENYSAGTCSGCRDREHHGCSIEGCFILECTMDHNVDFCGECVEFPCSKTRALFEDEVYDQWLSGNQDIQENGIGEYWKKNCEKPHYQAYKLRGRGLNTN